MTDKAEEIAGEILKMFAADGDTLRQKVIIEKLNAYAANHAATIRAECLEVARRLQQSYEKHPEINAYKHAGIAAMRIAHIIESMGESEAMERDDG